MIARIKSWLAWRRFQSATRKARKAAQVSHARTREIDSRQRAIVNAALGAGR